MKTPGSILLIACYELGHQPLSVAWAAAFLERRGYAPALLDVTVDAFDAGMAARARLVAIAVPMHTALRIGVEVATRVRRVNPTCHLCFFGLYASLNAEYLRAHGADAVIGGESEEALVALVEAVESGSEPLRGEAGGDGRPRLTKLAFPTPSRRGLPALTRYVRLEREGTLALVGAVETSRGCRHLCRHCPIPPVYGGRFFVIPKDVCLADIRQLAAAGATHITFADPDFLNGPGHSLGVARAVHEEFPHLTFDVTAKVEHLLRHRARLPELAALGCVFVVSAVESLSDAVLTHLAKGHTRADVPEAARAVRGAGLSFRPTWVPFTPWTLLADYRDMLDFIAREHLIDQVDPVQYSIRLLVPPGSLLLESAAMQPFLGALIASDFCYEWRHPDPSMDDLQVEVAAIVAAAAEQDEDPILTFHRIRGLADERAGIATPSAVTPTVAGDRPRPPRLTEPWFC